MIKLELMSVGGWEAAIVGMRNAMNSWHKSDSLFYDDDEGHLCRITQKRGELSLIKLCQNDHDLMMRLIKSGDDHGKLARYLDVYVNITAPFYWWKEFKTYRKGRKFMDDGDEFLDPDDFEMHIETNSCSTMHKIHEKEFTLEDFSHEHLDYEDDFTVPCVNSNSDDRLEDGYTSLTVLELTIKALNHYRKLFLETGDKKYWYQMIQLLPSSYNQKRTVKLNYQVLKNMYHARKTHKLNEWREFCKWIEEELPYSELITGGDRE